MREAPTGLFTSCRPLFPKLPQQVPGCRSRARLKLTAVSLPQQGLTLPQTSPTDMPQTQGPELMPSAVPSASRIPATAS